MEQRIRALLLKHAPGLYYAIKSIRFFRRCKERFESFQDDFVGKVYKNGGIRVLSGPFEGMPYYNKVVWGPIAPKWIGSYEEELHEVVQKIVESKYRKIIDVGAAEGYYAVGFGYKCPESQIISYDIDPIARYRQKQLAAKAGVTNLEVRKYCSHEELQRVLTDDCLVIFDIEGFELELADPGKSPALETCDILVEIHNAGPKDIPEVERTITSRFATTHEIQHFGVTIRNAEEYRQSLPELQECSIGEIKFALEEGRMRSQRWLWLKHL